MRARIRKALIAVAVLAAFCGYVAYRNAHKYDEANSALINSYCNGNQVGSNPAISYAEYEGCTHHVSATRIYQLDREGDQTAINAVKTVEINCGNDDGIC